MSREEFLSEPFLQDVKSKWTSVQGDQRMPNARHRYSRRAEQLTTELFPEISGVLDRIVEMNLPQSSQSLPRNKSINLQSEARLIVIEPPEASGRTFQVDSDIVQDLPPSANISPYILSWTDAKAFAILGG
jgi:hypothetical protein